MDDGLETVSFRHRLRPLFYVGAVYLYGFPTRSAHEVMMMFLQFTQPVDRLPAWWVEHVQLARCSHRAEIPVDGG